MSVAPSLVLAPYAVSEHNSRGRGHPVAPTRDRSQFQRDYTRVLHSHAFRRLQGKTQVFPAEWSEPSPADLMHADYKSVPGFERALAAQAVDAHRTRMSHSFEVEQVGRSIARALRLNQDLTATLAIGHDIGHAPFGHTGQDALNDLFADHGGFEHNHHALRLVDVLEHPYPEHPGLNLMFETREGLLKHCSIERAKTLGPVAARHLTGLSPPLEMQAVDVADQIAYLFGDLEDAIDRFVLAPDQLHDLPGFSDAWERCHPGRSVPTVADLLHPIRQVEARACLASVWRLMLSDSVDDVIATSRSKIELLGVSSLDDVRAHPALVGLSPDRAALHRGVRAFSRARIYENKALLEYRAQSVEALKALHADMRSRPSAWGFDRPPAPVDARDWLAGLTDRAVLRWFHDLRATRTVSLPSCAPAPSPTPVRRLG